MGTEEYCPCLSGSSCEASCLGLMALYGVAALTPAGAGCSRSGSSPGLVFALANSRVGRCT
jgi:hypothetical protein